MKWTRATPITKELLAQDKIHATFFKIQGDTLVPLEFAMGPSPLNGQHISPQFIIDIVKYFTKYHLSNLIAIRVGDFTKARAMDAMPTAELEVVWGSTEKLTSILPLDQVSKGVTSPVPTG